jgi:NADH-quinone oxidoreductase subunit F
VREAEGGGKIVVCSAVDADWRAQIARHVLRSDPRAVLEGLLIAAHAVGAESTVLCVSAVHDGEIATLEKAAGDLPRSVRVERIPVALVAGEETALIRALEGRQPLPFLRAEHDVAGVGGAPTLVESAETLAAVAALLGQAAGDTAGAKVVAVFGDVAGPVTVVVPLGASILSALEQAEGRAIDPATIKGVQVGGPAGRFLAGTALDTPLDGLEPIGACLGWGGIEVFATGRCGVEMARDVTARLHEESCGKCVFCREGTRQLLDLLNDVVDGRATEERMELLHELGEAMKTGSICSLGWGAALPALSALDLFADDFKAHLEAKRCPGGGR